MPSRGWAAGGVVLLVILAALGGWRFRGTPGAQVPAAPVPTDSARARVAAFWDHYRRATSYRTAGDHQEAASEYETALALQPGHEDALYYLGNARFELGDFAAAEDAWRRLAAQHASAARAHSQLGMLYACPDRASWYRPPAAAAALEQAAAINREETGPLIRLGQLRVLAGDHEGARQALRAVVATNPRSVAAHFLLGYVAWSGGDRSTARAELRAAVLAAQPPALVEGVLGEGDRTDAGNGWRPSSGCPSLDSLLGLLVAREASRVTPELDSVYAVFRSVLP